MSETPQVERDKLIEILVINAYKLWGATLTANRAPSNEALYQLLRHPQPGDMVLEVTNRRAGIAGIGTLLKVTKEPPDGWDEKEQGEPAPLCEYWYIRDLNGNEQRWFNCDFIRVIDQYIDPIEEARKRGLYDWQPSF